MNSAKFLATLAAATAGIAASATAAGAVTFTPLPDFTDTDFRTQIEDGLFAEDWVVESRGGNNANNGDFEIDIWEVEPPGTTTGKPATTDQHIWVNQEVVDFTLEFDGSTVTYTVDGEVLSSSEVSDLSEINTLLIRTRSNGDGSVMELTNLTLDGETYDGNLLSDNSDTVNYLMISDIDGSFTLTGQSMMSWSTPKAPTGSKLAYQIKAGYVETADVPEPASISFLSLGLVGGMLVVSRRR